MMELLTAFGAICLFVGAVNIIGFLILFWAIKKSADEEKTK